MSDERWERLRPLLPLPPSGRGRPRRDDRAVGEGILWRLATGAPWRDSPEWFAPWKAVCLRFRRWNRGGVLDRALAALLVESDAAGDLDWSLHFVDGPTVRAHQRAAGAKRGAATGRSAAPGAASRPSSPRGPNGAASRSPSS